jgi:NADH:ubiquinone oxidoreductase subunit F (NADH-binding)
VTLTHPGGGVQMAESLMAPGRPRILGVPPATTLRDHERRYGPLPHELLYSVIPEIEAAGLRGRGGAGFPTHVKMKAVEAAARRAGRRRSPIVVANGTEGEPASAKDKTLVRVAPHLVVDGVVAAAVAVGAKRGILCIDQAATSTVEAAHRALAERAGRDPLPIEVALTPSRYIAGEETALVSWLNGGPARPTFVPPRPSERGVGGAPTLVDNVETLANVALIARFGAEAYRLAGEDDEPGTILVTVRGAVERPAVYETELGTPLAGLLHQAGAAKPSGILVGGYFGTWITPGDIPGVNLSTSGMRPADATIGCGLVAVMPEDQCPLFEVGRVLRWLAASSAGQCGACVNGLPALSGAFDELVTGDRGGRARPRLDRWSAMVVGRGACKLPDGAVRFLDSARRVFAGHVEQHRRYGPCRPNQFEILPTPAVGARA